MAILRLLAAAAVFAAMALSTATAGAQAPAPAPAKTALAIAGRYWGAVPCSGQITLRTRRTVPAGLDPLTDAWVTFGSSLGPNDLTAPASSYTGCTISLARWRWPTAASMRADWDMLCTTMVHEVGHLLGHAHDSAPRSVMAPIFTDRSSVPESCRASRPGRLR